MQAVPRLGNVPVGEGARPILKFDSAWGFAEPLLFGLGASHHPPHLNHIL